MEDALNHPDIIALLDNLTHDNWFEMLYPISDRLRELGDDGKADRCVDLIVERKRPFSKECGRIFLWYGVMGVENSLGQETVDFIDRMNGDDATETIQPQLTGYLLVPNDLRIRKGHEQH